MKKYIINVTQEDIDSGWVNVQYCPVALAIKRKLKANTVAVGDEIYLYWRKKKVLFWTIPSESKFRGLPSSVDSFMKDFDAGKEVQPFSFELEV